MSLVQIGIAAVERGWIPDGITRHAIRRLCGQRLRQITAGSPAALARRQAELIAAMHTGPVAPLAQVANEQHYELPPEFFCRVLGPRRKYSCCYWDTYDTTLAQAEESALTITCQRAELADGQDILELGCGWGSLALWMAEHYPHSRITAISNSMPQRAYIEAQAQSRRLGNLRVLTADMNDLVTDAQRLPESFDRVVSVEMFEHMRNYPQLLTRIANWLRPDGKLFVHVFCHKSAAYPFESAGPADWMAQYFFTAGLMPSFDLLDRFDRDLQVTERWAWNGRHYQRTAEAWLANLDAHRKEVRRICAEVYGPRQAGRWLERWRMFFLAVAELFGYEEGVQWHVAHYLLQPVAARRRLAPASHQRN